ncbi:glycine cleavage system protein GcvH [Streptomyces sp. WAC08241]|uniref:glycine cleavage system protein GcvH n=1 Tax=Streptomyces sp. WAC08241 TaxID=2487421 RepID=UPI000F777AB8|nr:glycine cleavage system protein GcvH [Streptomyces sp. WAC08241]RSS40446.1 glycine cleavage system protein GcvH [Streptomyces sp. WAC08241]
MSSTPEHLKYTKEHEWVEKRDGGRVRVGITDHAQMQLGDIVFVENPKAGDRVEAGDPAGNLESVKAVSELYAPLSGRVTAVNGELDTDPDLVNNDPYGDGWLFEVEPDDAGALDGLLSAAQYEEYVAE